MKVLIVALGEQQDIKEAFSQHADVIYWDWTKIHNFQFNSAITSLVDRHSPDIVFMQLQTANIITPQTAQRIASKAKIINWTGDVRHPTPRWFIEIGKYIHLTLFSNMVDVEFARANGIKSDYLQIGFPNKIFKPEGKKKQCANIIFMGNNSGAFPLSKLRLDMVKALHKRYGDRFEAHGGNWNNPKFFPVGDQHEEAAYYRGAKIGINLSHFNYSRYSSDRLWRLMGAGCMCLTHNYTDIEKEFEIGKHLDIWSNFTELFEKIDYYLENEDKRALIAKKGCEHVHANHTWSNRITELMQTL